VDPAAVLAGPVVLVDDVADEVACRLLGAHGKAPLMESSWDM
jgi:hypothetical protein